MVSQSWSTVLAAAGAALVSKTLEIEKLEAQIARLRRMQFGRSSEKIASEIEQLVLRLEELEAAPAVETSFTVTCAPLLQSGIGMIWSGVQDL